MSTNNISIEDLSDDKSLRGGNEILKDPNEGTYSDLRDEINSGTGVIKLSKIKYVYTDNDGDTITINKNIDGNGAVIDMQNSGKQVFYVTASHTTIKNLTIMNANYNGSGAAVYFNHSGTVENCNFINNTNTGHYDINTHISYGDGGAVYFYDNGSKVINSNF